MSHVTFFFDGWLPVLRTLVVGAAMYVALVVFLRVSGSRSLASMDAFDFIVTVAIGAVFGRALTARDVALVEAVAAFALLLTLQFVVGWIQVRWPRFKRIVTNPPVLLYFRGEFLRDVMEEQRFTEGDLRTAVRKEGIGTMDDVEAIVLESAGDISVVTTVDDGSALDEVAPDEA